ncbi:hypothetical protein QOM21_02895 [Streptomyces sp. Pv4-95]
MPDRPGPVRQLRYAIRAPWLAVPYARRPARDARFLDSDAVGHHSRL